MRWRAIGWAVVVCWALAPTAQAALPTVTVESVTTAMPSSTGITLPVSAACPAGARLVGAGGYVRNATDPATVPTIGLVLGGAIPAADGSVTALGHFAANEAGDRAASFALCTPGSAALIATATRTGQNAAQETAAPIVTTATCGAGTTLIGGGAATRGTGQVNDGATPGNTGTLKPMASYPSDAAGVPVANGGTATGWSGYGSAETKADGDQVTVYALCAAGALGVEVARADTAGQNGVLSAPVSCPAGTRLLGGGYRVDETTAAGAARQPQQGWHMRGSFPLAAGLAEVADGTVNPGTWMALVQAGAVGLSNPNSMNLRAFAMCQREPPPLPDLGMTFAATPDPATVGQPLTYTLTLTNRGGAATGVSLRTAIPGTMTFNSVDDGRCALFPGEVRCTIGALAAGASVTVKIVVTPGSAGSASSTPGAASNQAGAVIGPAAAVTILEPRMTPTLALTVQDGLVGVAMTPGAALSGGSGPITLTAFSDADCRTAVGAAPFTPAAPGTYYWRASYGGDSAYTPAESACAPVVVRTQPMVTLTGAGAVLSGAAAPGGTLTFATCTTPPTTVSLPVTGNGSYASPFPEPFAASYSGDAGNAAVRGTCSTVLPGPFVPPPAGGEPEPRVPSNAFKLRRTSATRTGRITLSLDAPGAGTFRVRATAGGKTYASATKRLTAARRTSVTLAPGTTAKRLLRRSARVKVTLRITFTPVGGTARTTTKTITIKRSR